MSLIVGLDLETTGLSLEEDEIIELALVLWDTKREKPLRMFNHLVKAPRREVTPEITMLTGICQNDLDLYGYPLSQLVSTVNTYFIEAEAVVAHNGVLFDKPMLENNFRRQKLDLFKTHWVDSCIDVPYPPEIKTRKLTHLAAEHGFVNPFAHRALFDVLTMLRVMSHYDFDKVLTLSKEPSVKLQALCQKPWEDDAKSTEEAKGNGYRWDGKAKQWVKVVKESQLEAELKAGRLYQVVQLAQ